MSAPIILRMKRLQRVLVAMAVALCFLIVTVARAVWVDAPTTPVTIDPSLQLPLNTTSAAQRKAGLLLVNKTFTVNSDLNVGGATGLSQICWNDPGDGSNCKSNWGVLGVRPFVHLYPSDPALNPNPAPPEQGYAALTGTSDIALKATSAAPNSSTLFSGVAGLASSSTTATGFSAGVFGDASTITSGYGYGVLGEVADRGYSAFAAYFKGKVALFNTSDLIVGTIGAGVQTARENSFSEVCLNDACKPRWESTGTSSWSLDGTTLFPSDAATRRVSAGSGAFSATWVPASSTADVSVNGNATLTQIVIGDAPSTLAVGTTCRDGICNGRENDTFGDVNYCPVDCDRTAPGNISILLSYNAGTQRLTITWDPPIDPDYAGTRVIATLGTPPTGPFGSGFDIRDVAAGTTSYESAVLSQGTTYYFRLYAYDLGGNFASGVEVVFAP